MLDAIGPSGASARGGAAGLIRSGAIVAIAVAVSNVLNVVFQLATARLLPPAEYSLLVTLFSVLLIANVPILSLQARVARQVAHAISIGNQQEAGSIMIESLRPLARWGGIVLGIGVALAIPFAFFFNVDRELPVLAAGAAVLATLPLPVAMGGLQASERFVVLGAVQLVYAVLKVAVGVALAALGFGAGAILFGLAAATMLTFVVALLPLRPLLAQGRHRARRKIKLLDTYTRGAALVLVLIAALTNLDLIASRLFLAKDEAGVYAAVSVAARSLLLLPIVATTVLFPRVAKLRDLGAERSHLLAGLLAVTLLGLVPLVLFFAIPEQLIQLGFGSQYVSGQSWLGPLGVAMLLYALVEVYLFHFLALGRVDFSRILGLGLFAQLLLFALFHSDAEQIIAVQIVVAAALLVGSELFDRLDRGGARRRRAEPGSTPGRDPRSLRPALEAARPSAADAPSVSVVLPTYNNAASLPAALESLAEQRYPGRIELLVIDGGSDDRSVGLAREHGARIIDNPLRNEEEARALGLEAASCELVLLLDADNELPDPDWLARLAGAIPLADDVVSADPLFHEWRRTDPPVTRLCALLGGTDPLAIDLGWGDRWASHLGRWTGLEIEAEEVGGALLVSLDPERPPPMGSNGFLVRREALLATKYRPFVHSDVVGDLAEQGWRFARVPVGVVHHYAPTLRAYARKARRRARRSVVGEPPQRRGLRVPRWLLALRVVYALTLIGPTIAAARGYRAHADRAWALLPALYVITTLAYVEATLRAAVSRGGRDGVGSG